MAFAERNQENVNYMIHEIKKKLDLVNEQMVKTEDYNTEQFDGLLEIYEMIKDKSTLSVMEKEAIISEMGTLRSEASE